jgi:uncharacterized protein (TIGR03118 family)
MRHPLLAFRPALPQRSRDRRPRRGPGVEGLESRSLLSAVAHLAAHEHEHEHVDAKRAKVVSGYQQTDLVSDIAGVAQVTDSSLVNSWGLAASSTSPFWVSDQGSGSATVYSVSQTDTVTKVSLNPTIVLAGSNTPNGPTGQVFNSTGSTTDFQIASGPTTTVPADFIFDTLQGTIEGWNAMSSGGTTAALIEVNNSSTAVYTGLALGSSSGSNYLYAVNEGTSPGIQVFSGSWAQVTLAGAFVDPKLPKRFEPYNIANVNGNLYVTYRGGNFKGGAVAEFNTDGTFIKQLASNKGKGNLQSPWGVALAPAGFGKFSNDLLVGNFTSGRINAYNAKGRFVEQLVTTAKKPISIPGLWSLAFGNGAASKSGPTTTLFFTAGIDSQTHGLFGSLQAVTSTTSGGSSTTTGAGSSGGAYSLGRTLY